MSQDIFDVIDPADSGTELATILNDFKDAIVSGCIGTARPTNLQAGGSWIDNTNDPVSWTYKIFTGTTDISVFTLDLSAGVASVALAVDSFQIKKVSADTVGAVLGLIKNRISGSGQVLSGDVVGEIQMIGRTDTSTNPVVAKIIFTASDDMTSAAYGGTLSFQSTPDGTAALTEHMRLINGLFETVVPHKLNSQILVGQNVATTATIAQVSATKILVEMTGSTQTNIQGINSAQDTQKIVIHNRSTAIVTLKNQDPGAASADRLKLPSGVDFNIAPDASATLYYCTTDVAWKLMATSLTTNGFSVDKFYGAGVNTWVAPGTTTSVTIRSYRLQSGAITERSGMVDVYGAAYAWGVNANGQLGLGDVTPRSSPVAVLGGFFFSRTYGATQGANATSYGISNTGAALAWGVNTNGQVGNGGVAAASSPVAVLGGFKFSALVPRDASVIGITTSGFAYAWGVNVNGQLGTGDVTPRSSPVAVLGGIKFAEIDAATGASTNVAALGLSQTGVLFAWGVNTNGNLGVGDVNPRSSPVAVLGSLAVKDIGIGSVSSRYFSIALTTAGQAYAWGSNLQSNLGVGDQTSRSSPVAVLGGLVFQQLVTHAKSETVMALTPTGQLYSWGDNTQGVLGVGDIINRSSPVAVLGGLTFTKVRLFKSVAAGIAADGTLYMWGNNPDGELGVGDILSRSSPVAVLGSMKWTDVAFADGPSDSYSVMGIGADGNLYTWGTNSNGTLGLGDVVKRSSPVAVLGSFAPDPREFVQSQNLTVTPGQSYSVGLGVGNSFFGPVSIGRDAYRMEIEYIS